MRVYVCQNRFENVLTAVYDAWASGLGHENVRLEMQRYGTLELFCEYVTVETDSEKSRKVIRSIRQKISEQAYRMVYDAFLSSAGDRADVIYRFLIAGFRYGKGVTDMLQHRDVYRIFQLDRAVGNEARYYVEFLRFCETAGGALAGIFAPEHDVLPYVAEHFSDRFPDENLLIYDEGRHKAAVHRAGSGWWTVEDQQLELLSLLQRKDTYSDLWKVFFDSIAIRERINPRCQQTHLPLHFRRYMTEFMDKNGDRT